MATAGIGGLLALTPFGTVLEERFGLSWLFWARGPLPPPPEVAVISLDREASERFGLPARIREWPRTVYAQAIDRLAEAGASVIVLDLIFEQEREEDPLEDAELVRAIAQARRVVLLEYLDLASRPMLGGGPHPTVVVTTERVIPPLEPLAEAAAGLAPFPLPKTSGRVTQFWLFRPTDDGRPTLPVVALQQHALSTPWLTLLRQAGLHPTQESVPYLRAGAGDGVQDLTWSIRHAFQNDATLAPRLHGALAAADPAKRRVIDALITAYAGPDSRYLNFYGPPGQVLTVPIHELLVAEPAADLADLAGRAVFVGHSELANVQRDGFSTVFSRADGVDLSGVEIAATAFANLLEGRLLEPGGALWRLALLAGFGFAVGVIATTLPALIALPVCLVVALAGFGAAVVAFAEANLWLPVAVPALVQLPVGLIVGITFQYRDAQRARQNLSRGIRYYLPEQVAAGLAEAPLEPAAATEQIYGVCLKSDAERFTSFAESKAPSEVNEALNRYFGTLFATVERQGGIVTDVVGDGMTAVWSLAAPERDLRLRACRAGLEIDRAVEAFNLRHGPPGLPTRIGLHAGMVMLGNVGGGGHFAYSVVGDTANTAARIETLNKQLGTRLLATAAVTCGLEELAIRPLGRFVLVGKQEPLAVCEILGHAGERRDEGLLARFAEALVSFDQGRWREAATRFEAILAERPADGPAKFYLAQCRRAARGAPRRPERGVIRLEQK
jgi:adenylate cyclase